MENKEIVWSSFRKRITIEKPINELYSAWSTKAGIEAWFLENAEYKDGSNNSRKPDEEIKKGDAFTWKWHNWDIEEKGVILNANGVDLIAFTFGSGGNVKVELKPAKSATEVILIQDNIPTDEKSKKEFFVGCSTGWTFWLCNLKAWMEHGITLNATGLKQGETADLVNS